MFQHTTRAHFVCILVALLIASCSREQARLDNASKTLVERRASQTDAEATFGRPVTHIYTRAEVTGYYAKTRPDDLSVRQTWERLMAHPETLYFGIAEYQLYLFLNDDRQIVGYDLTSQ
jgi:hypothetical protein